MLHSFKKHCSLLCGKVSTRKLLSWAFALSKSSLHYNLILFIGVVHPREVVRITVVKLFSMLISGSSDFIVINRIIPAILTLSNDQDM